MSNPSPQALAAAKALNPKSADALADIEAAEAQGMTCAFSAARDNILKAAATIDQQFAIVREDNTHLRDLLSRLRGHISNGHLDAEVAAALHGKH